MPGGGRNKRGGSWASSGRSVRQKSEEEDPGKGRNLVVDEAERQEQGAKSREQKRQKAALSTQEEEAVAALGKQHEAAGLSKQEEAAASSKEVALGKQHEEAAGLNKQQEALALSKEVALGKQHEEAAGLSKHEEAATAAQKQQKGDVTKELLEAGKKHHQQEQPAYSSANSSNSFGKEVSGDTAASAPNKKRNKIRAQKRKQASLRKKEEEEATAQNDQEAAFKRKQEDELGRLKQKHEEEIERLKQKHGQEIKAMEKKHEEEAEELQKRQGQDHVEAEESKKSLQAEQLLHPADPYSPVEVNSPPTHTSAPFVVVANKGMDLLEMHRDYLPEYSGTGKSKAEKSNLRKINKNQGEDLQKKLNQEEELKKLKGQKLRKLDDDEEEEEVHKKQQQQEEEGLKRNLDRSLTKDGVSYAESAKKAVREAEMIAQQRAETASHEEARAKQQAELELKKKRAAAADLEKRFINFLTRFVREGTEGFFYKSLVKFMNEIRLFNLNVDFQDILMAGEVQLGVDLVNANSCEVSLLPAVRSFLSAEGLGPTEAINWKAELTIYRMPHYIDPVSKLMEIHDNLVISFSNIFGEGHCGYTLAPLTSALFGGFADQIFDGHEMGRTWNGKFRPDEMYVVDKSYYVIAQKPEMLTGDADAVFRSKKDDLKHLVGQFRSRLDCRKPEKRQEEAKDSDYPLYFPELCKDIETADIYELGEPWFRVYIVHHPSLKMPLTRHNFVCDARLALQKPYSSIPSELKKIIEMNPVLRKDRFDDWRGPIEDSNINLLTHVYEFVLDGVKGEQDQAGGAKGKEGGAARGKGKEGRASGVKGKIGETHGKGTEAHERERFTGDIRVLKIFEETTGLQGQGPLMDLNCSWVLVCCSGTEKSMEVGSLARVPSCVVPNLFRRWESARMIFASYLFYRLEQSCCCKLLKLRSVAIDLA
ncbi:hypothetical protein EJB05_50908 [Eragrostis curvula]|uniref:Uncharacterized protein n=1 Tax=Eragrostis curvula TaxID=38414 RepID=A0A5J9SYL0_9POAL|nr:hypothetical protein EJB05_50908 [Eragrostis curvula]